MSGTTTPGSKASHGLAHIIAKNAFFVTLGEIVLKVLTFLFNVYVVRQLGDDRFGQYSIVLAYVSLFQIFAELGMTQYVMREIARDSGKTLSFLWNLVALRFLLALLAILVIPLSATAVGYNPQLVLGIFIYTLNYLLSALLAPLTTVLTANERFDYVTALNVTGRLFFVVFGALVLYVGWGFIALIVVGLVGLPLQIGLALWALRRHRITIFPIQIVPKTWPHLVRAGLPFGIISLALTIAYSIDTIMLSMYHPEQVVGWYNVAYNLVFSITFFFGGFHQAIVPSLSRTYVQDPVQVERWYHRSVKFIAMLSMPITIGGMLLAFPIIHLLYTKTFTPSALALQILIWDVPLILYASFCGNITTIIGQERAAARIYTINAIANVILNLVAIPTFGLVGAALVTVVTDLIGTLQFYFLLRHKLNLPPMTSVFLRILFASILMGAVITMAVGLNLFILIGFGAAVYAGLILMLRLIDETERTTLLSLLARYRGGQPANEAGVG